MKLKASVESNAKASFNNGDSKPLGLRGEKRRRKNSADSIASFTIQCLGYHVGEPHRAQSWDIAPAVAKR